MATKGIATKAEQEFEVVKQLRSLFSSVHIGLWKAAELLFLVRDRKGYQSLGYDDFADYCEGEVGKAASTVHQLLKAYEVAILKYGYKPEDLPDPSKVYLISGIIEESPGEKDEWMQKAHNLTAADLRREKRNFVHGEENACTKWELQVYEVCVEGSKERHRRFDLEKKLQAMEKKPKKKKS